MGVAFVRSIPTTLLKHRSEARSAIMADRNTQDHQTTGKEAKRGHLKLVGAVEDVVNEVFDGDEPMPWEVGFEEGSSGCSRVKGEDGLTPRQRMFVKAMLAGAPSASAAYRGAYTTSNMADKTIWNEASRLMAHPVVSQMLREGFAEQEERAVLSGASRSRFVIERIQHEAIHATAYASRVAALVALGKTVALFTDKLEDVVPSMPKANRNAHTQGPNPPWIGASGGDSETPSSSPNSRASASRRAPIMWTRRRHAPEPLVTRRTSHVALRHSG